MQFKYVLNPSVDNMTGGVTEVKCYLTFWVMNLPPKGAIR